MSEQQIEQPLKCEALWGAFKPPQGIQMQVWDAAALSTPARARVLELYDGAFEDGNVQNPSVLSDWDVILDRQQGAIKGYVVTLRALESNDDPAAPSAALKEGRLNRQRGAHSKELNAWDAIMVLVQYDWGVGPIKDEQWLLQMLAVQKGMQGLGVGHVLLECAGHIVQQEEKRAHERTHKDGSGGLTRALFSGAGAKLSAYTRKGDHKTQRFYVHCGGQLNTREVDDGKGNPMCKVTWSVPKMLKALEHYKAKQMHHGEPNEVSGARALRSK